MAYQLTDEDRQLVSSMVQKQYGGFDGTASSALNFQKQQSAAALPKKKKNFWEDNISTAGSLGGALAGGAAGTAILPGVGTLIGALLGGAAGGFGGQVAENKITGEQDLFKDAGTEALWGGATALPFGAGLKLAKAGGTLAKGLGSDAAKTAAKGLVNEAGVQTIGKRQVAKLVDSGKLNPSTLDNILKVGGTGSLTSIPQKTSLAGKLDTYANKSLAKQYGAIGKPTIREANPAKTIPQLAEFGVTKPADAERLAGSLTGKDGILNKVVINSANGARNVDTAGLRDVFTKSLDNAGIVGNERKSIENIFKGKMNVLNGGSAGSLNGSTASDAMKVIKDLGAERASLLGQDGRYHMPTTADKRAADVLKNLGKELENRLYGSAGANANLKAQLTPELRNSLISLHPNNTKWASYVDNNVMNANSVSQIRSAQAPFVNVSKIINDAANNEFSVGGRMVTNTQGIKDAILQKAAGAVANPVRRGIAGVIKSGGGSVSRIPGQVGQSTLGQALRMGGIGATRSLANGQASNQVDSMSNTTSSMSPSMDNPMTASMMPNAISNMDTSYQNESDMSSEPSIGGYSKSQIENAMAAAIMDGNSKAFGQLQSLYELLPKGSELSATAGTQVASNANATNTLSQLEGLYGTSGGGLGKIGGSLQNALAGAGLNGDVQTYNDLAASSVSQLARALNGGGQVSDADAAVVIQALPKVTDSPEVAARKFAALKDRLQNAMQNTLTYSGGADSSQQTALQ